VASANNLTRDEARRRAELISDLRYRIHLDLTGEAGFRSETTIHFTCSESGAETFLDLTAPSVSSIRLNGRDVGTDAFDGNRLRLTGLAGENEVQVVATCSYHRTELGMHRFVDPADGRLYLHTDFEPFDAAQH